MNKIFNIGVIGSTSKGDYGHGVDTAFTASDRARILAVADDNPAGLKTVSEKLGVTRRYLRYEEMLQEVDLDIVCIGPRWVTARVEMVEACARFGCHIYCEKPLAGNLADVDAICRAVEKAGIKMALAHQFRGAPTVNKSIQDVSAGLYGKLLRMYGRPKDDARGGGEELIVHGCHLFNLMIAFAGEPRWVSAHISVNGRDAKISDRREATEPVGPIAGDSLSATFGFDNGVRGFFDSTANIAPRGGSLYGLRIECEHALLHIRSQAEVSIYPAPVVLPEKQDLKWERMILPEWHYNSEGLPRDLKGWLHLGNHALSENLMDAIEYQREPATSLNSARAAMEMIQGVYASHFAGRRLSIPLEDREHPLARM
ncbi:MAG: Gfo/Idh/MocA family oxidoreductase [Planctomycetota bacterium]|nr:Gfo/Idh/MocA family oxidoreductase [Planctomycetota bacterium]